MSLQPYVYYQNSDGEGFTSLLPLGAGNGATVFTELDDVPITYAGQSLKFVRVNTGATALEFVVPTFLLDSDTPDSFASQGGKYVLVNTGATALEFNYPTGITNGSNAATGKVGEYLSASSTGVSLVTNTAKTITSISLTAGDWDVSGVVSYLPAATTSVSGFAQGSSATTNALGTNFSLLNMAAVVPATTYAGCMSIPNQRFILSSTTTVYLVGRLTFTVSTATANGEIFARRMR